jgi:hypothetical protein
VTRRVTTLVLALALLFGACGLFWRQAQPDQAAHDTLSALVARADVMAAVGNANAAPLQDMKARDGQWRAEMAKGGAGPLVGGVMATALSRQLELDRVASDGRIEQIMVMDARGALVAADHPTHDYDQSDEPKWRRTIGSGNRDPVFEGRDKSGSGTVDQLSQSIIDEEGRMIGAVTLRWRRDPVAVKSRRDAMRDMDDRLRSL